MNVHLVVGAGSVGSAVARQLAGQESEVVVVTRSGSGPEDQGSSGLPRMPRRSMP